MDDPHPGFTPCHLCGQYSHSLGEDQVAKAYMHFQSMGSHGFKSYPTHHLFDEATRDQANVLVAEIERLRAENARLLRAAEEKKFPILGSHGAKICWQLVADHGRQCQKNHYQTVERLAERGGLSWSEMHAVLHNRPWQKMDENQAIIECRALETAYRTALAKDADHG